MAALPRATGIARKHDPTLGARKLPQQIRGICPNPVRVFSAQIAGVTRIAARRGAFQDEARLTQRH